MSEFITFSLKVAIDFYQEKRIIFDEAQKSLNFELNAYFKDALIIHGFDNEFMIGQIP